MGNVTFFYPPVIMNFSRAYVRGFALPVGCVGSTLSGMDLLTTYSPINQFVQLRIQTRFFAPSSNHYSLDYVFDLDNCWSYIGGVLSPGTIALELGTYNPDRNWRIRLGVGLPVDLSQSVNLPVLANYWRPFPS